MKKKDKQALRGMTLAKLHQELVEAQKELVRAKLEWASGRGKGQPPKLLSDKVAVIKTIIREKELRDNK